MSLIQITNAIENFVNSERTELLVVKGGWGVGKSHFWNDFIRQARRRRIINCDYYTKVSVFGQSSLDDLRTSIGVSRVQTRANPKLDSIDKNLPRLLKEFGKVPVIQKYGGGSVASLLFAAVRDTLVCIDDIERKGSGLELRDILGLANHLKEERNCKVALIVNEAKLGESQEAFELDGEKVIDREVQFSLTPAESFGCVFKGSESDYELIKDCVFALGIGNLRILQRIQRFIEDIHPLLHGAEKQTREEVIRSLILLVWSRYGRGNGAPPMELVLNYSLVSSWFKREQGKEETDDEKRWASLLGGYYFRVDEISTELAILVKTGYVANTSALNGYLQKRNEHYKAQKADMSFHEAWQVYTNSFDDNEQEVIDVLGESCRTHATILGPWQLQEVVTVFRQLNRNREADKLISDYFQLRNSAADILAFDLFSQSSFRSDIKDEYICEKLVEAVAQAPPDTRSLLQVIEPVSMSNSYDLADIRHLNTFSEDDFYEFFRSYKDEQLYRLAKRCLDFRGLKGDYEAIGQKTEQALRRIAKESQINRARVTKWFELEVDLGREGTI